MDKKFCWKLQPKGVMSALNFLFIVISMSSIQYCEPQFKLITKKWGFLTYYKEWVIGNQLNSH